MSKLTFPLNENDHTLGSAHASITLVEYGDYQCPYCGAAHFVIKEIRKTFGKKLRFGFRNFPLATIHELALPAAKAAEAAARQNKFWQMHDMIYENQSLLSEYALLQFATELGLNIATFKMDFLDREIEEKIEADFESGMRSGVNGTPSFFINGYKYNGNPDYDSLVEAMASGHTVL